MPVDHEIHVLTDLAPTDFVGQATDAQKVGGLEQGEAVGERKALLLSYFLFDGVERIGTRNGRHGRSLADDRVVQSDDPPGQDLVADVAQTGLLHQPLQFVWAGKAQHRGRQIGVRGAIPGGKPA